MKRSHYILILGALLFGAFVLRVALRSSLLPSVIESWHPGRIPASSYARLLDSSDPDEIMHGFYHLTKRADPIAVARGIDLLSHEDDYIWLNAALYLGACKRQEAVPYLIKALRHTAWRSDSEKAQYLRTITGADFGADFGRWQQWWLVRHPDSAIDWNSHLGHAPRIAKPK